MPLLAKARSFLRNLFLSRRVEVDLDLEVHSHLEMLIAENIRAGMPPHEAQRARARSVPPAGHREGPSGGPRRIGFRRS
jgi:hypothetical protein